MAPRALGENAASKKRKQQSTLTSFFATNKKSASRRPAEETKQEETTSKENAGDSHTAVSGNDAIDEALASENLELQRARRKREEITIIHSASSSAAANSRCSGDAEAETALSKDSPAKSEGLGTVAEDTQESTEEIPSEHQPNNQIIPIKRFGIASSSNIAHKLLYQSLHGGQRRRMVQHTNKAVSWNVTNWIQFPVYRGFRHVTQVAWDSQGDLLAAAYYNPQNGVVIAIYDWHTVSAADFAGRRRRQRGNGEAAIMEPILAIPVRNGRGAPVEVMEWNPYNPDEIVVGLRASKCVYSFDLEAVNGWQGGTGMPPCRELRCYEEGARRLPGNSGGAVINQDSCFRYLEAGKYAVLSAGTAVFCWKLGAGSWVPGAVQLHWKFQYKDTITAMAELSPETIVFGSCRGRLAILNWKKLQRSSFSLKAVPTLVDDWLSFQTDNPKNQFLTPSHPRGMGVQFLRIVKERPSLPGRPDLLRLVWLTASGWVLSSQIEAPSNDGAETEQTVRQRTDIRRKTNCRQHFTTEAIKCFSDTGEQVGLEKPMWCIPTNRIPVCGTGNSIFWEKVEDNVVQRLPNQDERVLTQSHTEVRRSSKPRFLWMSFDSPDGQSPPVQTVPISKRAGQPTCTAVHSNHEWVVVGTSQNGIYLINARNKPDNRSAS